MALKWVSRGRGARSRDLGGQPSLMGAGGQGEPMAMILEFRSSLSREEPREPTVVRSAEIIIFPGVRRERHAEPQKMRRREKARPKRDRLELPD